MTDSLVTEYKALKKREKKLISEEKKMQKEQKENVNYFVVNHIWDKEWRGYLEKSACHLAIASVRMKIAKEKMKQIRVILHKKLKRNKK